MSAQYLSTLPNFIAWLSTGVALTVAFAAAYMLITPQREITLIRQGNVSAAISFGGALLGFVLPLASAISHGIDIRDLITWGIVALVVQLLAYVFLRIMIRELPRAIEDNKISIATFSATISICAGLLNAACMTY
jgi:putative membrane protein